MHTDENTKIETITFSDNLSYIELMSRAIVFFF